MRHRLPVSLCGHCFSEWAVLATSVPGDIVTDNSRRLNNTDLDVSLLFVDVENGAQVFERDHVLVLAQCVAGKDMETLWRGLNQVRRTCMCMHGTVCYCEQLGHGDALAWPQPDAPHMHACMACMHACHCLLVGTTGQRHGETLWRDLNQMRMSVCVPWFIERITSAELSVTQ